MARMPTQRWQSGPRPMWVDLGPGPRSEHGICVAVRAPMAH